MAEFPFQAVLEALIKARQAPPASAYAANAVSTGLGAYNTANEQRMKNEQLNRANLVDLNKAYLAQKYTPTVPTNGAINMQGLGGVGGQFGIPGAPSGLPTATSTPAIAQPEQLMGGSNVTWNQPQQTPGRLLTFNSADGSYSTQEGNQVYDYDKTRDTIRNLAQPKDALSAIADVRRDLGEQNLQSSIIGKFNSDMAVKKYQQAIDASGQIITLLQANNPVADMSIPTYAARMAGEVGALTEADKAPFGGSQAIVTKLNQAISKASTGKMTSENRQFMMDLANTINKRQAGLLRLRAEKYAKQYGGIKATGGEKALLESFDPNMSQYTEPAGVPTVGSTDERGTIKSIKRIK